MFYSVWVYILAHEIIGLAISVSKCKSNSIVKSCSECVCWTGGESSSSDHQFCHYDFCFAAGKVVSSTHHDYRASYWRPVNRTLW